MKKKNIHSYSGHPIYRWHLNEAPNRNKWVVKVCMNCVWSLHFPHKMWKTRPMGWLWSLQWHISWRPIRKCIFWWMFIDITLIWVRFPMCCAFPHLFCMFIVNDCNKIIRIEIVSHSHARASNASYKMAHNIFIFGFSFYCHHLCHL